MPQPGPLSVIVLIIVVAVLVQGLSAFAVTRFGVMVPFKFKSKEERYPSIRFDQIREEVEWLQKSKTFFVLYSPDESSYLSFGYDKNGVKADLAFAVGKFRELEPNFTSAVKKFGGKPKPYRRRGMEGVEAELGSDLDVVADKIRKIIRETFDLRSDAKIPVMRNK